MSTSSSHSRLSTNQLFAGLTPEDQEFLMSAGVTHLYKKGEIIFREGGIPMGIFYVESGRVKKFRAIAQGGEQISYLCAKGELLGYHALLGEVHYPDSAATIEDSMITFIPKDDFLKVLRSSTALSNSLLRALGVEFIHFINSITNLATKSARERLAINLLMLEEKFDTNDVTTDGIDINLSRTDLANMIGTATETLVRLLQEFKKDGLIEKTEKSIRILDRKGLIREANLSVAKVRK